MQYDGIIATFGELFLKGKNRQQFIDTICRTIQRRLAAFDRLTYTKTNTHLAIELNGVDPALVVEQINKVFGIRRSQLYTHCASEIEAIKSTALAVVKALDDDGKRIKIAVKRADKTFALSSPQVASMVGRHVAAHSDVTMDLVHPDLQVKVQIQRGVTYIVSKEIPALGGLPIGINGTSLLMLSGGLDSPVAGYLMMKRGLAIEGLHFDSPPYTSPRARQKVFDLAEKLAHYQPSGRMVLHMVPFTALQKTIFEHVPASYGMTIMRRMMYRVAEGVARRICGCALISNGESLGQVASQTPQSMLAINAVITMPVIRPVACMDKSEIVEIARRIGTHGISIRPYEDCCTIFVPKSPSTAPKALRCEQYEAAFDWVPLLEACLDGVERVTVEAGKPIQIDEGTSAAIGALL